VAGVIPHVNRDVVTTAQMDVGSYVDQPSRRLQVKHTTGVNNEQDVMGNLIFYINPAGLRARVCPLEKGRVQEL
jgi:hypothetical protein